MKILAISAASHDSNFCMYDTEKDWFQYVKIERINGNKHSPFDFHILQKILIDTNFNFDVIYSTGIVDDITKSLTQVYTKNELVAIQNNLNLNKQSWWWSWLTSILNFKFDQITQLDHHYAHILSGWPIENINNIEYGVCIDGRGSSGKSHIIVKDPADVINRKLIHTGNQSYGHALRSIGLKLNLEGQEVDLAGKIMGANAYGTVDWNKVNFADYEYIHSHIYKYFADELKKYSDNVSFEDREFRNFISTSHEIWKRAVCYMIEKHVPFDSVVSYSGGCAQNTITNTELIRLYPNMTLIPHCYDGGLSLGCMACACIDLNVKLPSTDGFPYWQFDNIESIPSDAQIKEIAEELANGKIVAWHQGRGEIGPRALGNRSILMNPTLKNGKNMLNNNVKHREHWRPYAPSVLIDHVRDWFEFDGESPYMMMAVKVKSDKCYMIPSVTHKDRTSRIQTVSLKQNKLYYKLITEFYKLTGIPMLLNTSLNVGGSPIVHSKEETISLLKSSGLDLVCIGNEIIRK